MMRLALEQIHIWLGCGRGRPAPPAGEDGGAAGGAAGVGAQPGIDAGRMEAVAAERQQPELVSLSQHHQADGALPLLSSSS